MFNKLTKLFLILTFVALTITCTGLLVTEEYAVLNKPIKKDAEITVKDVEVKRFLSVPGNMAHSYRDLVGKTAKFDLPANTQIGMEAVSQKSFLPEDMENMVTVPIPVVAERVPSSLKEGDLVNLIFAYGSDTLDVVKMSDANPFIASISTPLTVVNVSKTENVITKVDVITDKETANDIMAVIALSGDTYLVSNSSFDESGLKGMTVQDLYVKYYKGE